MTLIAGAGALMAAAAPCAHAQSQVVEIVGTSPLPGGGIDRSVLPYATQIVRREDTDSAQAGVLTELLTRRLPGVQTNDIQGNPFQVDLSYRGQRASGLLGAAQGLSVYLDGVRINEPFGDVVNWDLVPEYALQSVTIVPGANPAFGLNTLAGALVLETADGRNAPGWRAEAGFGNAGRARLDVSQGQHSADGWHSLVSGTAFREHGWRDHSPGRVEQLLAKIGHARDADSWDLSLLAGRSTLVGNGLLPAQTFGADGAATPDLYAQRRSAVYTNPDRTRNRLGQLALHFNHRSDGGLQVQALAYVRSTRRDSVNGDVADDPDAESPAALNTTGAEQTASGLAASLSATSGTHRWQAGAVLDISRVGFTQFTQPSGFDEGRGVVAGGAPAVFDAQVAGHTQSAAVYASDTWQAAAETFVTATLRVNRSRVGNTLTTRDDASGDVQTLPRESFGYASANPALGVAQRLGGDVTVLANAARNARVPTAIELGCADATKACRLPAGLQSDPFLAQVRSTNLEAGLRWLPAAGRRLELTLYRNDNHDDILFASAGTSGQLGFFQNFARTRYEGLDLSWQAHEGALDLSTSYSRLDATYQAAGTLRMGQRNVQIEPGTRIAALPGQTLKLGLDLHLGPGLSIGADAQWLGSRGVTGNEDGRLEDGDVPSKPLRIGGYGLLHLRAAWQARPGIEFFARVNNVFDRRYESYGALATTVFDAQGAYTGEERNALFVAPGAPRACFFGVRFVL